MAVAPERTKTLVARLAEHAMVELKKLARFVAELVEQPGYWAEGLARSMMLPPIAVSLYSSAYALQAIHRGKTTHHQPRLLSALLRLLAG